MTLNLGNSSDVNGSQNSIIEQLPLETRYQLVVAFLVLTCIGLILNAVVLGYIIIKGMYKNFVSSHFIAHLCFANILALTYIVPIFLHNMYTSEDLFDQYFLCSLHVSLA